MDIKTRHLLGFLKQLVEDIENGYVQGEEFGREYEKNSSLHYQIWLVYKED